jgi:cytochrome c-type biogenesis protein CcmE
MAMAAGGLAARAGLGKGRDLYRMVDQVVAEGPSLRGARLQVHGFVAAGSVTESAPAGERRRYRFRIETHVPRPAASLEVFYEGGMPDTFGPGAEVIVAGGLDESGTLVARTVSAKCADPCHRPGPAPQGEARSPSS